MQKPDKVLNLQLTENNIFNWTAHDFVQFYTIFSISVSAMIERRFCFKELDEGECVYNELQSQLEEEKKM